VSAWENYHLEWSADPLSVTNPTWQDITSYALAPGGGPPISIPGITSSTGASDNGNRMTVSLDNSDHRFTFGNTSSPLSPNWKPGRRIRCYETIAGKRFDLFTGFIQPPETSDWAERGVDQYMTVSAIDRLGRAGTGRPMVSVLGEHILYNAGTDLVGYWTMSDPVAPFRPVVGSTVLPVLTDSIVGSVSGPDTTMVSYRNRSGPPGDDLTVEKIVPVMGPAGVVAFPLITTSYALTTSQTLGVSAWVLFDDIANLNQPDDFVFWLSGPSSTNFVLQDRPFNSITAQSQASASIATLTPGPTVPRGSWTLVTMRVTLPSGLVELWVGPGLTASGTMSGSPPASMTFDTLTVGEETYGSIAHLQIYSGATAITRAMHLAQYAMGRSGLAGQTTGQRIVTLAKYAGVPATDLGFIDPGIATMQQPTFAGKTPLTAMREAETTEQGRLRTNGQGLLVFDPRTRRYNS
jgi:hypothetical protein